MTISSSDLWEECWVSLRSVVVKINFVKPWTQNDVSNILLCRLRLCERIRPRDTGVQTFGKKIPPSIEAEIQNRVEKRELLIFVCKSSTVWLLRSILYSLCVCFGSGGGLKMLLESEQQKNAQMSTAVCPTTLCSSLWILLAPFLCCCEEYWVLSFVAYAKQQTFSTVGMDLHFSL